MDDLVAFVRQQLDEDERVAESAGGGAVTDWRPDSPFLHDGELNHIERWDPPRVLADVEAKRRILDLHAPVDGYDPNGPVCSTCGEAGGPGDETAVVRWPCLTVRLLAQPYAGREGWRVEWAA